jgi:amidase
MGVQGPLARSAFDLELLFDVLAGPVVGEDVAWRLALPAARADRLRDFRVAVMPAMPWVRPSAEMVGKVDALVAFLGQQACKIAEAMPAVDFEQYFNDYLCLLTVATTQGQSREQREATAREWRKHAGTTAAQAEGLTLDAVGYLALLRRRETARAAWREFFKSWDVLIGPMALDVAFEHKEGDFPSRTLLIDNQQVPYMLNVVYPMWAIFAGQPSTAFPAGLSKAGLPLGLQAIGPYLEDRTTLRFAQLLERQWEGFRAPPGY